MFETENNDTLLLANPITLDVASPVELSGEIGNNPELEPENDLDWFAINLNSGDTIVADLDAEIIDSKLDSVLTIFDVNGNQLAQNDDNVFDNGIELDSFLQFTATQDDTFYLGVSSFPNLNSTAKVSGSGTGDTSGIYNLTLRLESSDDPLLNTPINRFQDSALPGSYLYAGPAESQAIRDNFPRFIDEGTAFQATLKPDDELIGFYRFRSNLGTYLLVAEDERNSINSDPNFSGAYTEEGLAFYVYDVGAGEAETFHRLRNLTTPGNYLYATGGELANIQNNLSDLYFDEGPAFEAPM